MILLLISWINEMVDKGYLEQGLDSLDVVLGISGESDDKYKSKEDGIPLIGTSFQILSDISKREMYLRFKILKKFNDLYQSVFPFIDLTEFHVDSLPSKLFSRRNLIFRETKMKLWEEALNDTVHVEEKQHGLRKVKIDRVKAASSNCKAENTIFEQLRGQLTNVAAWQLRPKPPTDSMLTHMSFEVDLEGEMNDGGPGGPYREVFASVCKELQAHHSGSSDICLLNRREEDGTYIFSMNAGSPKMLHKVEFLGTLIGIALRTHAIMPLDFAEVVWKTLTHEGTNERSEMLVPLSGVYDIDDSMAPSNSPGDDSITSEYEDEYNDVIVEAIHTGMSRIIPTQLLRTFTWREFKRLVCGETNIDIDLLQRHTKYHEKVDQSAKYIEYFWNTLRGFDQEERSRFIQFAYAQPRIPGNDAEWLSTRTLRMRIMPPPLVSKQGVAVDLMLPTAQTCFFDVHLPKYTSEEAMKRQLRLAISS